MPDPYSRVGVGIHPIKSDNAVLVKVMPAYKLSSFTRDHTPCDIILVIDASEGMVTPILRPGNPTSELHAARTIVSTLDETDRVGVVRFGANMYLGGEVLQVLGPVTPAHKMETDNNIDGIRPAGPMRLWDGIQKGLEQFGSDNTGARVPVLMVLTGGQLDPSLRPPEGYVGKLRSMSPLPAIINIFGFGEGAQSAQLKSIAEASHGTYSYISDADTLAATFANAAAHLQSTYATRCVLKISAPEGMLLQSTKMRSTASVTEKPVDRPQEEEAGSRIVTLQLGNLQYGQTRDIYLKYVNISGKLPSNPQREKMALHAELTYLGVFPGEVERTVSRSAYMSYPPNLPPPIIAYHQSRSIMCELLASICSLDEKSGYEVVAVEDSRKEFEARLRHVTRSIPAKDYEDELNMSLMMDLNGPIRMAVRNKAYFRSYGQHYLISLWDAHAKQLCNSLKFYGPQQYNKNSPLFIRCRARLNIAFAERALRPSDGIGPGFAASSPVLLDTGDKVPVGSLQQGMRVQTPVGPRCVRALLKTLVHYTPMCRIGDLDVSPWHPVKTDQAPNEWDFPWSMAGTIDYYSGIICSVLLEPDTDPDAHAIRFGGVWGVTLGHGIMGGNDGRAHEFLGYYDAVLRKLRKLGPDEHGVYSSGGVMRDPETGGLCGFIKPRASIVYRSGNLYEVLAVLSLEAPRQGGSGLLER
ncbi:hint-domain-containing protein [Nemania sp. NC0429]|nr:hint-domain-containing protein [Nemania sp. NC0429]